MEERHAVVSRTVEDSRSLLFVATEQGRASFVDFLLDECQADTDQRDHHCMAPSTTAAIAREPDIMKSLIRHGADVNAVVQRVVRAAVQTRCRTKEGWTLLHVAVEPIARIC